MASKKKKKNNNKKNNSNSNLNKTVKKVEKNENIEEKPKEQVKENPEKKEKLQENSKVQNKNNKKNENKEKKDETKEEKVVFKNKENEKVEKSNASKEEKKVEKASEVAKTEVLEQKEDKKRKFLAIMILTIVILLIILIFSTIFAMLHSTKNTIAKGVSIRNIDVSGLTYDEAKNKLNEAFKTIYDENIELKYKDEYSYKITPEDVELSYDFKNELDEAYSIGRKGNIIQCNYSLIFTSIINKNINIDYKFNEDNVNSIVEEVATSVPGIVSQYSHYIEDDNLIINPGKDGIQINKEKLKNEIINNFKNREPLEIIKDYKNITINIPYEEVKAEKIDMDKVYSEVHSEPQDAYFVPATETEKAKIFADVDGIDFAISIDEAKQKLLEETNEYIIPITRKKAEVTINDIGLEAFPDKIQEFSTRYDASLYGRSENLRIATSKIDGTVLMPGQQFSFNGVVGERTVQEGYKNAAIYEGDSVVDGLAGGICQISSTLYNAALLANLQIDERYNHSFKPSYVEAGRDATVVYGIKDFKFTNTRSYPIKIEGSAESGVVTFSIYGILEDTEYKINIIPVINSTIPYNVKTVQDTSLAPGQQVIKQIGATGYRTTTYKETVLNGAIISKEVISNDLYKAMDRIIRVGPAVTEPVQTPTQEVPVQ